MKQTPDSITVWFENLRQGDADAATKLWERFFDRLVSLARVEMRSANRRVSDEEDIAAGVIAALCRCADEGRLPSIDDRESLWRMLLTWTRHDIADHLRADRRLKRGGGRVRGGSAFDCARDFDDGSLADPALLMELNEQYHSMLNMLPNNMLRSIAELKMAGHSNNSLAKQFQVTPRTIQRKLELIREVWSKI